MTALYINAEYILLTARNVPCRKTQGIRRVYMDCLLCGLLAVVVTYAAVTDMANPPTFTFALVGTQFRVTVTNPALGVPCIVECYLSATVSS